MTSFIFVVSPENLRICLEKGICGAPRIPKPLPEARGLADISGIRPGSNILFYEIGTKAIMEFTKRKLILSWTKLQYGQV